MPVKNLFFYKPPQNVDEFVLEKPQKPQKTEPTGIVAADINTNLDVLKKRFFYKTSYDAIIREFDIYIGTQKHSAATFFIDGLVDNDSMKEAILQPLMIEGAKLKEPKYDDIINLLIPQNQVTITTDMQKVIDEICYGSCVIFIDGFDKAVLCQVIGWRLRGIESPKIESAVYGPQEGLSESIKSNTSTIRRTLRSDKLVIEYTLVGKEGKTGTAILYMSDIANPSLVDEVKRRIQNIDADYVITSSELEQFIEQKSIITLPQMISTERPDRCCKALMAGRVVVIVDNSPLALIAPATFFDLITSAEDAYLRPAFAVLVKAVRLIGMFCSVYLPAIYLAIITYHQSILPTSMLTTIMMDSKKVPFNPITELFVMVIAFEIIREASVRMPGILGGSLGIVGPLVLGQAAISANIASPVMIIVYAISVIGSFATPNYSMAFSGRVLCIIFIILAGFSGFLGIGAGVFLQLVLWQSTRSFGVQMLIPDSYDMKNMPQALRVLPIWKKETRPKFLMPQKQKSQAHISRVWKVKNNEKNKNS